MRNSAGVFGSRGDARLRPDLLVVDEAVGVAGDGDAVVLALVGLLGGEAVLLRHVGRVAERLEERRQLLGRHRVGDQQHVAVVAGVQPDLGLALVVLEGLELDVDVRVDRLELLLVVLEHRVDDVGALGQHRDVALDARVDLGRACAGAGRGRAAGRTAGRRHAAGGRTTRRCCWTPLRWSGCSCRWWLPSSLRRRPGRPPSCFRHRTRPGSGPARRRRRPSSSFSYVLLVLACQGCLRRTRRWRDGAEGGRGSGGTGLVDQRWNGCDRTAG